MALIIYAARLVALAALLFLSARSDLRRGKIYNKPVLAAVAAGFALGAADGCADAARYGAGAAPLASSALGFALPFLLLGWLCYMRALGAGDVKLFMAVGSLMGAPFVARTIAFSFVIGGAMALARALRRRVFASGARSLWAHVRLCAMHRRLLPYCGNSGAPPEAGKIKLSIAVLAGAAVSLLCS